MKLYYFNPGGCGSEYFVMAKNKDTAYKSLLNYFRTRIEEGDIWSIFKDELAKWEKDMPLGYSLNEYDENIVIETEIE